MRARPQLSILFGLVAVCVLTLAFQNCSKFGEPQLFDISLPVWNSDWISLEGVRPAGQKDGHLDIQPDLIFPTAESILPEGTVTTETMPNTLDLGDRAAQFIQSQVRSAIPGYKYSPAHAIFGGLVPNENREPFCQNTTPFQPCYWTDVGVWGLVLTAMQRARQMTAFDRDNAQGSLTLHRLMLVNGFDVEAQKYVAGAIGVNLTKPSVILPTTPGWTHLTFTAPQVPITGSTFAMETLMSYLQERPSNSLLKSGVVGFLDMHQRHLNTAQSGGGTYSYYFDFPLFGYQGSELGFGPSYPAFIQGEAAYALFSLHQMTGHSEALATARKLLHFLKNWVFNETGTKLYEPNGYFKDHLYSMQRVIFALIADAEIRRKADPTDPLANDHFQQANNLFNFIKTQTRAGAIGNFGETGTSGEMIRLAIRLTENGVGSYYDEVEYWLRNMIVEAQIPGSSGSGGSFFSDATHIFAVPTNQKNFRYNVDGAANAILAMADVWDHIVTRRGETALVNVLLNKVGSLVTVKSDLPYRGKVELIAAGNIGALKNLAVRIPNWAPKNTVSITARDRGGNSRTLAAGTDWAWTGNYAFIFNIQPGASYSVNFPIQIFNAPVVELRTADQAWYEASHPACTPPDQPGCAGRESLTMYTGTFRGYDLVSATPAPVYTGVNRFQRQNLAALPPTDVAPPVKTGSQFMAKPGLSPTYQ